MVNIKKLEKNLHSMVTKNSCSKIKNKFELQKQIHTKLFKKKFVKIMQNTIKMLNNIIYDFYAI
jgi:hypothetical protein